MLRSRVALALFVLIAVASIDLNLLRSALAPPAAPPADPFQTFLAGVRERTQHGDSIALLLPLREWDAYAYHYYRASYALSGREVLPVVTPGDGVNPGNVARASHVAVWRIRTEGLGRPVRWQYEGGVLLGPR